MSLAENIKRFREIKQKTQRELADDVQVTAAYIALLETGDRANPSTNVLSRIAKALDVQVNDLLNNITQDSRNIRANEKALKYPPLQR